MRRRIVAGLAGAALMGALASAPSSSAAVPDVLVSLPFNIDCIAPQYVVYTDGDCDGMENTIIDDAAFPKAGATKLRGITFKIPSRAPRELNSMVSTGQTVTLGATRGYKYLQLLGFGTDGATSNAQRTVTVRYRSGAPTKAVVAIADVTAASPGRAADIDGQSFNNPGGAAGRVAWYLSVGTVPLDPRRVPVSMTMPPGVIPLIQTVNQVPVLQVMAATLTNTPLSGPAAPVFH